MRDLLSLKRCLHNAGHMTKYDKNGSDAMSDMLRVSCRFFVKKKPRFDMLHAE